jgi:hypothetical protein
MRLTSVTFRMVSSVSRRKQAYKSAACTCVNGGQSRVLVRPGMGFFATTSKARSAVLIYDRTRPIFARILPRWAGPASFFRSQASTPRTRPGAAAIMANARATMAP